jgi:prepilin-type N-terminal cleavage/methylation domain-containing protein
MKPAVISQQFPRRAPSRRRSRGGGAGAFTLIEIMIVVAVIGLVAAMGVPSILQIFRKEGMRKAVSDVQQLLGDARARAIFSERTTQVVFHPAEKRLEIADAPADASPAPLAGMPANNSGSTPRPLSPITQGSVVLPDNVDIAMLDINLLDYGASEVAYVRFFPNGTCDELTLVLHSGDEWQKITLEFSTAMATAAPVTR